MILHRVLLVSQDPWLRSSLNNVLEQSSATILIARDAGQALQAVCDYQNRLGLAVIDFSRYREGIALFSAIRTCQPLLPVIVVTSNDATHVTQVAYANGALACLIKPVTTQELAQAIGEVSKSGLQKTA